MESSSLIFCKIVFKNHAFNFTFIINYFFPVCRRLPFMDQILSGYLFPFYLALTLVCFCSATGATLCYLLSYLVGTKLVNRFAKERAQSWAKKVNYTNKFQLKLYLTASLLYIINTRSMNTRTTFSTTLFFYELHLSCRIGLST